MLVFALAACANSTTTLQQTSAGKKVIIPGGSYTNVTPTQLKELLANKNFPFINVHVPYEGEIENTDANIPYDQIEQTLSQLPADKNAMVFLYCRSGNMSATAAETLVRLGYTNVWNLEGGFREWERQGFPLIGK